LAANFSARFFSPKEVPMTNKLTSRRYFWVVILLLLAACAPHAPIRITDVSVHPDPLIGRTATAQIEITSSRDEQDVTIAVTLPDGVKLMSGELEWKGSLKANQSQTYEFALCVLYPGDWELYIRTYSLITPNNAYGDTETLHLITTTDTAQVVPGGRYTMTQPPGGMVHPTSVPQTPPTDICP
jgi:hypothetical protein